MMQEERGKKMKRALFIIASLFLMLILVACGNGNTDEILNGSENSNSSQTEAENTEMEELVTGDSRVLVVYYSSTGNTKDAAEKIAVATEGDLFELVPSDPYTAEDLDWSNENSRVYYEHENPDARAVPLISSVPENFSEYDTVFIGYPIWWGIAAWPVNGFVEDNNFTGKTVVPFCTSASSGLGESGELLAEAAGTGNWLTGRRFSSGVSRSEIENWLENIGIN